MGILRDLKEAKQAVFIPVDESDVWYSVDSPEESFLDKLIDRNSDGQLGIWLYRFNGLSRKEREAVGASSERIREIQKEYLSIIGANSRKYQLEEDDINRAVTVTLGSSGKKQVLSRLLELAERLDEGNEDQEKTAVNALTVIAKSLNLDSVTSLDDAIAEEKKRNLTIVEKLGDDFTKLGELNEQNAEAQQNYNCELIAGILSSPLRVVALENMTEAERKSFKVTAENVKNLAPGLVRALFTEFVNKENQGKSGWLTEGDVLSFKAIANDNITLTAKPSSLAGLEEGATYQVTAIKVEETPAEEDEGGKGPVKKSGKS